MSNTGAFSSVITGVLVLVLVVKAQDIGGTPDVDYPNYDTIPKTSFSCSEQKYIPGLYADMETGCQVFHFCEENMQESFLCPPGRAFNQASLTCDSWDNFNCSLTPQFHSVNTGPEMDNARRNILMVLQLKNRSRSKLFNRPSDVYDKITSLYDDTVEEHSESPDVPVGLNAESSDGVSHEVSSEEMLEEVRERSEENEHGFNKDLSGIDERTLNDEFAYVSEESEDSEPEIFYDPVTEKYFIDYDPLQTVHEVSKEEFDKVGSLSYDGFSKRFGLSYNENVDEMQSDSENEYSKENDLKELSEMLATEESKEQLLKTMWNTEPQSLKRVRRRPLYRVVKQDAAAGISGVARNLEYPIDSTDTEVNFEFSANTSGGNEKPEKATSDVSYEVPEFQYSNIASPGNPEVPQTLEFDQAVLSELSFPEVNEHGLRTSLPSDEEQDESMQRDSQTYKTADEYSYIENSTPVDYESYFTDYTEVDTENEGEPEFAPGDLGDEGNTNWYQDQSLGSEDSDESEDTYMVIPDEYDNAFDHSSGTNEQPETYNAQSDATGSFGASRDFSQSYISPAIYAPVAPYWLPPPYYYPDEYGSREVFNPEHFFNRDSLQSPEYAGKPLNDQDYQYYPLADSGPYAYGSPANFPGHVYDYGAAGYVYPYANAYGSQYAENVGYDTSEVQIETESSILNENSEAEIAGNSDYSEPEMQYWAERSSTESLEEEVTESVFPTEESLDNVYMTSDGELDEMPSVTSDAPFDENMKEETFYIFDFDENSDEELIPDATDEVLDNIQFGSSELFQAEEPSRRNESSGDLEGVNVGSESDSTRAQAESDLGFDRQNSKRLSRSETDENEKSIDSTFQTEGTSNDENPVPQTQRPRQPRSYGSNTDLSRGSKFLMDNVYSESNFRLQDAVLAQSYGTDDVSFPSNMEDGFFPRTGDAGPSRASKLSELQKRILSLKQGKLGTFKKYMNPGGKN